MLKLITTFWEIALFQRAPQDLPASGFLLKLSATLYLLMGMLTALLPLPIFPVIFIAVLDTLLLAIMVSGALYLRKQPERIMQTLTAVYGVLGLLGLLMLPVTGWLLRADNLDEPLAAVGVAFWLLYFWSIAAFGHILRHALSIPLLLGVLISYTYFFLWHQFAPVLMGDVPAG